ncbi:MAG: 4Fe-4S binding protein, partial [Epsilonproteobacteria bacterium]|nr:4Fe-4S binding protein [Campylobacterota bacterium]
MTKRKIIKIDEEKCTGCGLCIPNCPEGALQIIDGKVRLISDLFCDGLGACIGNCPEGAIIIEARIAEPYDERKVMNNIIKAGKKTILGHLNHLKEHGENNYLKEALAVLKEKHIKVPFQEQTQQHIQPTVCGCPGAKMQDFTNEKKEENNNDQGTRPSQLKQWPIQLHLVPPNASYYQQKDILLTAVCVGYVLVDFHKQYMKAKSIAIACPKLDTNQDIYIEKITSLINDAKINTITVIIMEVPCCQGLLHL